MSLKIISDCKHVTVMKLICIKDHQLPLADPKVLQISLQFNWYYSTHDSLSLVDKSELADDISFIIDTLCLLSTVYSKGSCDKIQV